MIDCELSDKQSGRLQQGGLTVDRIEVLGGMIHSPAVRLRLICLYDKAPAREVATVKLTAIGLVKLDRELRRQLRLLDSDETPFV